MNHRIGRAVFSLAIGLVAAVFAYSWITNPATRIERAQEENAVRVSRSLLSEIVASDAVEIVDPLAPDRKVGKTYVYAEPPGWAVSGYYRRGAQDRWHPYLLTLTTELQLHGLKVQDAGLSEAAARRPEIEIIR